jgi:mannose-1-phosphate guanylyltransferase
MSSSSEKARTWALVMAGGAGTRFWPMSRKARPKQLLPLLGGRSLLAATVDRLAPLVPAERILVATSAAVVGAVRAELPQIPPDNIVAEPAGRDTAACIGLFAWRLAATEPDAAMVVLPADHVIPDGAALRSALAAAVEVATERGALLTLALTPTRPETGFGYLDLGPPVTGTSGHAVHPVRRFIEKPTRERAVDLLARELCCWNSGMFAWTVAAIVAAIRTHLPELAAGLDALAVAAARDGWAAALERHYPGLPRTSIDFGVMEKAEQVMAIPVSFAWSDVGSWPGLAEVLPATASGTAVGDVVAVDCADSVLVSDGPLLAAIGVRDLVVVATRDAVLVVPKADKERVKELVAMLERGGRGEVL